MGPVIYPVLAPQIFAFLDTQTTSLLCSRFVVQRFLNNIVVPAELSRAVGGVFLHRVFSKPDINKLL